MYTATLLNEHGAETLDVFDSLPEAVDSLRQHWNEDEGPQLFVVRGEAGYLAAVLSRPEADPELAVTSYADGRSEVHRCVYVVDIDGRYLRTDVIEVSRAVLARAS